MPPVEQIFILAEVAEAAAEAHPGRNRRVGKQIQAGRGGDEDLLVILGNNIGAGVEVFVKVEDRGHLSRDGEDGSAKKAARIVNFEGESFAGADERVEIGRILRMP